MIHFPPTDVGLIRGKDHGDTNVITICESFKTEARNVILAY